MRDDLNNSLLNRDEANYLPGNDAGTARSDAEAAIDQSTAQFGPTLASSLVAVDSFDGLIDLWATIMEIKQIEPAGHIMRAVWWTSVLGRSLGLSEEELLLLRRGSVLHDIGKLALPESIFHKPEALNSDELKLIHQHPIFAYDWLKSIPFLHNVLDIPYSHHESWDGNGYPQGLQGETIPLSARIFSVVDSWDMLRTDRPYRLAWNRTQAIQYIKDMAGIRYDPQVVEAFIPLANQDPL